MRGERSDAEGPISGSGANNASARLTGIGYGPAEARPMNRVTRRRANARGAIGG